uniref:Uncharacterized protein n=1 Tax=Lotharella globosa TaxID=91324 RepID=A0A7S3YV88_9EUKA
MKANNKRDEIPDHEVITPASSPSPSPPAAPSAVAAAPAAPATPVTPATPSAPAAALPTTETEAAEAVSPVPPTPVLATTATVEPVAEVIEEVKETVVQELPPPVMEEPKRKKKKAAPPPPPMEFVVPLDDLPPVGGRGAAGREALTQLSRRLDPIKELAYGKPRPKKKIFDFGETEELIFKTFDPLGGLKSIEAPQGEFTLDPLPGGTRKKKAQPGTNMWGKEVASEPDPYFDAQEQVGQILGKVGDTYILPIHRSSHPSFFSSIILLTHHSSHPFSSICLLIHPSLSIIHTHHSSPPLLMIVSLTLCASCTNRSNTTRRLHQLDHLDHLSRQHHPGRRQEAGYSDSSGEKQSEHAHRDMADLADVRRMNINKCHS